MATTTTKPPPLKILFVTGNPGKLAEVQRMLKGGGAEVSSSSSSAGKDYEIVSHELDLDELQGEPEEVAKRKCLRARGEIIRKGIECDAVLIEDSSLCFNALGGLPGVFIKWFEQKVGLDGLVNLLKAYDDKSGYAQCIFAFCRIHNTLNGDAGRGKRAKIEAKDEEEEEEEEEKNAPPVELFVGQTKGNIVPARRGKDGGGFGWDPVFEYLGSDKTFAEMTREEKDAVSHRGKALRAFVAYLTTHKR